MKSNKTSEGFPEGSKRRSGRGLWWAGALVLVGFAGWGGWWYGYEEPRRQAELQEARERFVGLRTEIEGLPSRAPPETVAAMDRKIREYAEWAPVDLAERIEVFWEEHRGMFSDDAAEVFDALQAEVEAFPEQSDPEEIAAMDRRVAEYVAWAPSDFADRIETLWAERRQAAEAWTGPRRGRDYELPLGGNVTMEFVWIDELEAWVGRYETTNAAFRRFRSGHDSGSYSGLSLNGDRQPAVRINYDAAVAFCQWLGERDELADAGVRARLPTGDEWTAIARSGTNQKFPWGDSWPPTRGNYRDEAAMQAFNWTRGVEGYDDGFSVTAPVEESGRNGWGLYGVGGNVWEWTGERSGFSRVLRGASWLSMAEDRLRIEDRYTAFAADSAFNYGFRVVLVEEDGL